MKKVIALAVFVFVLVIGTIHSDFLSDLKDAVNKAFKGAKEGIEFADSIAGNADVKLPDKFREGRWKPLPDSMPLEKAMFLGSHNAYSTGPVFAYRQHVMPMIQQIEYGVRALMLDTHWHKEDVYLCRGSCTGGLAYAQTMQSNPQYIRFQDALTWLGEWLLRNPREIMFIFLENRVSPEETDKSIEQGFGKCMHLLFTEQDWQSQDWRSNSAAVTIGLLRKLNKRLFIFNEFTTTKWTMAQWDRVIENNFSTIDPVAICGERSASEKYKENARPLYLMNYFKKIASKVSEAITYHTKDRMRKLIEDCSRTTKRMPNFIFIDFIESLEFIKNQGTEDLLDLINEYNEKNAQTFQKMADEKQADMKMIADKRALLEANPRDLAAVRTLLEQGADPNATDAQGQTPLMKVVMANNCGRHEADESSSYVQCSRNPNMIPDLCKTIKLFFEKGAKWDIKDNQKGWTAYDYSKFNGMIDSFIYPWVPLLRGEQVQIVCP